MNCNVSAKDFNHSAAAINYLGALYKDVRVILESRSGRMIVVGSGTFMALGLDIGSVSEPDHVVAEIAACDWLQLSKVFGCFESRGSVDVSIKSAQSTVTFSSESQGWAFTAPANLGRDMISLPTKNLKAVVDLGVMASTLNNVAHLLGDEVEKRHRLEFGFGIQQNPVAKIVNRDGCEIGKFGAEFVYPPVSGLSINPAHLNDGVVLLKSRDTTKTKAKISDDPDRTCWMIQCADRLDYLLCSRFR